MLSCLEIMCAIALSCHRNTVWIQISAPSGSCNLSVSSSVVITDPCLGLRYDIIVLSGVEHTITSYSLYVDQFQTPSTAIKSFYIINLCYIYILFYGYKDANLGAQYTTMSTFQNNSTTFWPMAYDLTSHRLLAQFFTRHGFHLVEWALIQPESGWLFS